MTEYRYVTVDVFTDRRFAGNPLAVFPEAAGLDTATMQALAAELNYSETTFVLPSKDSANTAQVRIFNRSAEMPFAGHPNVGTAYVLRQLELTTEQLLRFEELAGLVEVRLTPDGSGAEIDAPRALDVMEALPEDGIARCLSISPDLLVTRNHAPLRASVGVDFVFVEVSHAGLGAATPDLAAYRALASHYPQFDGRLSIFLYALDGDGVRARMFAPLAGTWEDAATGSANATLAALRLHLSGGDALSYRAVQGVEMGRESRLTVRAWRTIDGIRASVGGSCVGMFSGTVTL